MMNPMSEPPRTPAGVSDLVLLSVVLERDEQRARADVIERDQRIGATHARLPEERATLALVWLDAAVADEPALGSLRDRISGALHAGGILLAVVGLIAGWLAALAAFYYDGSGRVNVIAVLAVLVGVPLLLLLAFIVAALPRRALAWLPGATAWSAMARGLSPGRLGALALRLAPRSVRETLERFRARSGEHQLRYASVQKWQLLCWSQTFAVAFEVAALTAMLALVSFTDLVFGWSTTLASGDPVADAAYVHDITTTMAVPWSWALEGATPSLELIRESRYYRVVDETVSPEQASRLGGWWPFVAMSMLVYGLTPRVVLLGIASWRLRRAVRSALSSAPGLSAVLRRIHAGQVRTSPGAESLRADSGCRGGDARRTQRRHGWAANGFSRDHQLVGRAGERK